jgi:exosortase
VTARPDAPDRLSGLRAPGPAGRVDHLLVLSAFALAGVICAPAARGLAHLFDRVEFYAHGTLVPIVAAYLVFLERRRIREALATLEPPRFGAVLVLAAGCFELLMVLGDVRFLAGVGISLVLAAVAYGVGGLPLLRPLALPLAFLALTAPPPGFVVQSLLADLKLLVTRLSVEILHRAGQTVYADGNRIEVPGHTLFVADACSGLTSIVTLLPVACVVAYFLSHGVWRRIVVVLTVVPLAMAANVVRVVSTVLLLPRVGPQIAEGMLHESFGLFTYAFGTVALALVARALR